MKKISNKLNNDLGIVLSKFGAVRLASAMGHKDSRSVVAWNKSGAVPGNKLGHLISVISKFKKEDNNNENKIRET